MAKDSGEKISKRTVSTEKDSITPGPFVKWAGGKSKLIKLYESFLPHSFQSYYEPFVGGGALFFYLYNKKKIARAYLNDSNRELINLYIILRDNIEELLEELAKYEIHKLDKEYYYQVRNLDRDLLSFNKLTAVQRAARVLYLNKTCYNGLYRVNKKSQFNVPFGNYKNPNIRDINKLRAVSRALKLTTLTCQDFQQAVLTACPGDFIYFDPPYYPVSTTSFFTGYTENSFSGKDQQRLAQTFRALDQRGCLVMLSNSCIEPVLKLYRGYRIEHLMARRDINSLADRRGLVPEIIVTNY